MKVYNGEGLLLGRLASIVAKEALLGEEVRVVNCESIFVSGDKYNTHDWAKHKQERKGYPLKSAFHSRLPDRFVRRSIRGMLPWKTARGKEAFKRIMCHIGIPDELRKEHQLTIASASKEKLPTLKYAKIGDICKQMTGRPRW